MSSVKYLISIFFLFLGIITFAQKMDSNTLKMGILPNGLQYYILKSDLQKGEVSLYLNQKVGSILEDDNQRGLAHFLEHMAFNGSTHFPDGVLNYLKSQGATQINAKTGKDETVYYVENINVKDSSLVDTCVYLLRDWSGNLLLKNEDIDKERGVITEEWRSRNNASKRHTLAIEPYLYNFSQYSKRDPIGDIDLIQNFEPDVLRDYYKKWYNTEHQAVIIVGDINPSDMEAKVMRIFADVKRPKNAAKRTEYSIPDNKEPLFLNFESDEIKQSKISIYSRREIVKDTSDYINRKNDLLRQLFNLMIRKRINSYTNKYENSALISANIYDSKLVSNYYTTIISTFPYKGKESAALTEVISIWETTQRYGFSEREIEMTKNMVIDQFTQLKKNKDNFKNSAYISIIQNNFNNGTPIVGIEENIDRNIDALNNIKLSDLNEWIKTLDISKNQFIELNEKKAKDLNLNKDSVIKIINDIKNGDIPKWSYGNTNDDGSLMSDLKLKPATIVSTYTNDTLNNEVWKLSNGVNVIYKFVDKNPEIFSLSAVSNGGKSLINSKDLPSSDALLSLITKSGVYNLDREQLVDITSKNQIKLNLSIGSIQEGMTGSSPTKNDTAIFQLAYVLLTHPKFKKSDFDEYVKNLKYNLENQEKSPSQEVKDSVLQLTTLPNDRTWFFNEEFINALNFESMKRIFQERFGNSRDFNYYIVGDIPKEEAKKMACLYLGNLPSDTTKDKEQFINYNFNKTDKLIAKTYYIDLPGDKAKVNLVYKNDLKISNKEKISFDILNYTLRRRFFNSLRKAESGTYGVNVNPKAINFPTDVETISISFETKKGKENKLKQLIYDGVQEIQSDVITNAEFDEAVNSLKKNYASFEEQNDITFWNGALTSYYERGEDITSPDRFKNIIDKIKPKDVKAFANRFFNTAKVLDLMIISK